jgi:hypothetical protein
MVTFENIISTKTITCHSIFDSDVYIYITKTLTTTYNTCPLHLKKVDVDYKTNVSFALQSLPPKAKTVTHYNYLYYVINSYPAKFF